MSCGCKQPNEDHGDERNITMQDLEAAADAAGGTPDEVVRNISQGYSEFGSGQAVGARGKGQNAQQFEQRQGGYGAGTSNSPQ
jgi:hypothetical protein